MAVATKNGAIRQLAMDLFTADSRRDEFLNQLRSCGKLAYKRYLGSPLRYAGGKSLAVGFVIELLPTPLPARLASPFSRGWICRDCSRKGIRR